MRVFKYLDNKKGLAETYEIYKVVRSLKPYAISKYKTWWDDALDESFFHILENYDSSKGDLMNYAIKVVGTIYLNKNRKEVSSSDKTTLTLDIQEAKVFKEVDTYEARDIKSSNFEMCVRDMIPYFIRDCKFFVTSNTKDRKLSYKEMFLKYSYETISDASAYLTSNYSEDVLRLLNFSKSVTIKSFSDDRYTKSEDEGIEYEGVLNNIILIRRGKGSHTKKLFRLSLDSYIDLLIDLFYSEGGIGKVVIEGLDTFVTLSGSMVIGLESLKKSLESELVGSILSRTSLKVVYYEKGREIIFSSTKDYQHDVMLPMFGKDVAVCFERMVSKEVS